MVLSIIPLSIYTDNIQKTCSGEHVSREFAFAIEVKASLENFVYYAQTIL